MLNTQKEVYGTSKTQPLSGTVDGQGELGDSVSWTLFESLGYFTPLNGSKRGFLARRSHTIF
jgi:hypothetical protein